MSEVEQPLSASELDQVADLDGSEPASTTSRGHTPQGDHEAMVANQVEPPSNADSTTESVRGDDSAGMNGENVISPVVPSLDENPTQPTSSTESEVKPKPVASKPVATKTKPTMSVKPPAGKSNGGPPTPLVKRVRGDASDVPVPLTYIYF